MSSPPSVVREFGSESWTAHWSWSRIVVWYPNLELASKLKCCHEFLRVLSVVKKQTSPLGIWYVLCRLPRSCVSGDIFPKSQCAPLCQNSSHFRSEFFSSTLPSPASTLNVCAPKRNPGVGDTHTGLSRFTTDSIYIYVSVYIYCVYFPSLRAAGCVVARALSAFPYPPTAPPCNVFRLPFG